MLSKDKTKGHADFQVINIQLQCDGGLITVSDISVGHWYFTVFQISKHIFKIAQWLLNETELITRCYLFYKRVYITIYFFFIK